MKLRVATAALVLAAAATSSAAPPRPFLSRGAQGVVSAEEVRQIAKDLQKLNPEEQRRYLAALRIDPRIVGGRPFSVAQAPYQVALVRGYATNRYQFCGGTLIAADTVVTAAHCIDNSIVQNDPTRVDIVSGTAFYAEGGERLKVRSIAVHPQWNSGNNDFDVAILKLQAPAALATPIPLDGTEVAPGTQVTVSGWGALFEGGRGSDELMAATLPVVDTGTCNAPESYNNEITAQMMCAGLREGGLDSCQGDSGGPLVVGSGGSARLVGIVSWGEGCARRLKYGVYTRVSALAPWIQSFTQR